MTVKAKKSCEGAPLRTDFVLCGADVVTLNQARERALAYGRMGRGDLTVRGVRSSFRDLAGEVCGAPPDVAVAALAHQIGSRAERSYARSDLLERRRDPMTRCAAFLTSEQSG
ncbi:hypothetical protein [Dinoroseobacter sp. S375]|uniref:hypothetical protein n=1 Tax=Dinoroseobacter sp. S375 TaxID=3415136 RepID=UPI003C7B912E